MKKLTLKMVLQKLSFMKHGQANLLQTNPLSDIISNFWVRLETYLYYGACCRILGGVYFFT